MALSYNLIAKIIKSLPSFFDKAIPLHGRYRIYSDVSIRGYIAFTCMQQFRDDNRAFKPLMFLKACGLADEEAA